LRSFNLSLCGSFVNATTCVERRTSAEQELVSSAPTTRRRSRARRPDDDGGNHSAFPSSTGDGTCSAGRHSIRHMRRLADRDNSEAAADHSRSEAQLRIQSRPARTPARRPRSLRAPAPRLRFFSCLSIPIYMQQWRANLRLEFCML